MSPELVGILGIIILLLVLFFLGMPVGFAMAIVGFSGFAYVVSFKAAFAMVGTDIWGTFSKYGLTVIPLFILMGYLAFNSGIAEKLYNTAYKWVGHWRGGLAIATIAADEFFAAICGSNTATAATMAAIALPQMKKYNYDTRLSSGTVVTGGTLGTVMPPIHYQAFHGRYSACHSFGPPVCAYHRRSVPDLPRIWTCRPEDQFQRKN
jgi:TRAP-type mannitol/chloroaromatic compound transport system permease large subunit